MNKTISRIAIVAGIFLGAFALSALANWSAPLTSPPTCAEGNPGCDAPINVGSGLQRKLGPLILGINTAGTVVSNVTAGGLNILSSTFRFKPSNTAVEPGKLLVSYTNSSGNDGYIQWGDMYSSSFAFKRSGASEKDKIQYCPATHPNLVHCSVVDNEAPADNSLFDPQCSSYGAGGGGFCDANPNLSSVPLLQRRDNLGPDGVYLETIHHVFNGVDVQGCWAYEAGHDHTSYRLDVICSK